jgi:hypothetical protein
MKRVQDDHKMLTTVNVSHTLVAGLLAESEYLEDTATGRLGTGFSWFPCV